MHNRDIDKENKLELADKESEPYSPGKFEGNTGSGMFGPNDIDDVKILPALWEIFKRSVPSVAALYLEYSILFINIAFIGYMDEAIYVAGVGLGAFIIQLVLLSVDLGICGGLDTLVSQAFGRKDYYL